MASLWNICVSNDHGYVPFVVAIISNSFHLPWHIIGFWLAWWVLMVEQGRRTFLGHQILAPPFSEGESNTKHVFSTGQKRAPSISKIPRSLHVKTCMFDIALGNPSFCLWAHPTTTLFSALSFCLYTCSCYEYSWNTEILLSLSCQKNLNHSSWDTVW